ncbi:hypothetical protein C4565_03225 [Candidatus Parcubacteria bacterium]|jgi:hypothetical protein|nr:MAG: hypothetical protein C4565_03225 [Candidatus Parcubacteria bacterium]
MEKKKVANIFEARYILGNRNVVIKDNLIGAWNRGFDNKDVGYTLEQLESAADANKKGLANWFLVYHMGKSPRQILEERFENLDFGFGETDRFQKNHWFSHANEGFWVDKKEESGYYLLNFIGERDELREMRLESLSFTEQEEKIKLLPSKMRAPLNVVMEAVFSIYDTHNILLLKDWYHLSDARNHDGALIYVGSTGSKVNEKMMNIFKFPKEQEGDGKYFYGFGAVLILKK